MTCRYASIGFLFLSLCYGISFYYLEKRIERQIKNIDRVYVIQYNVSVNKEIKKMAEYIRSINPRLSDYEANVYAYAVWLASKEFDIDPWIILRLGTKESTWRPYAYSKANAIGILQVIPSIHGYSVQELYNPVVNIYAGTSILSAAKKRYGSLRKALEYYSGGAGEHYYKYILGRK